MQIPNYQLYENIGRGRLTTVYRAIQISLNRPVVVKVMSPILLEDSRFSDKFIQQSCRAAALVHPNIIHVYDIGSWEQQPYLVLEKLDHGSLSGRIGQRLDVEQIFQTIYSIADALAYAHSHGVVHGDIRPANILFRDDDTPVVTDFGIAVALNGHSALTGVGSAAGDPHYISPEQARGKPASEFSDQYALGILFYQCLTGQLPFQADNPPDIGLQHIKEPVPRLPEPYRLFQPVIDKLLAKKPRHRYAGDAELLEALERLEQEYFDQGVTVIPPPSQQRRNAPRLALATAALLAVVIAGVGGWYLAPGFGLRKVDLQQAQSAASEVENSTDSISSVSSSRLNMDSEIAASAPVAGDPSSVGSAPATSSAALDSAAGFSDRTSDRLLSPVRETAQNETPLPGLGGDTAEPAASDFDDAVMAQSDAADEAFLPDLGKIELVSIDTETDIGTVIDDVYSDQTIDQLLSDAEENLRAMRLTTPEGRNARDNYQQILQIDPYNETARYGLNQIATRYLTLAREKLAYGDVALSRIHISRGLSVVSDHSGLLQLRAQISNLSTQPPSGPLSSDQQTAEAPVTLETPEVLSQPQTGRSERADDGNAAPPRTLGWGSR